MSKKGYLGKRIFSRLTAGFRAMPDFVIIGTSKGGTTSLYTLLSKHPEIIPADRKELQYYGTNYRKGLNWYKAFFPLKSKLNGKITGEATPYYLYHPLAPELLKRDSPNAKLIVMLREPVTRAYSHYQMQVRNGHETLGSFEEAVRAEQKRLELELKRVENDPNFESQTHLRFSYLNRGKYGEQLQRWLQHFPKSQFLVLKSEDFFADPESGLKQVYDFLGVKHAMPKRLIKKNAGRYTALSEALHNELATYYKEDLVLLKKLFPEFEIWE